MHLVITETSLLVSSHTTAYRTVASSFRIRKQPALIFTAASNLLTRVPQTSRRVHMGSQGSKTPASWPPTNNKYPLATFASGCFWGVELAFQRQPGVIATAVGYVGGKKDNPTYEQVCSESTGHAEAVQMTYDPQQVEYGKLVDLFYSRHNSTTPNRAGNDVGTQYRSGIYYHTEEQKQTAEQKKSQIKGSVTEIAPCHKFWPAEEYHQQYLEKGGRMGRGQSAAKQCNDPIRCYG